jgi:tetratricopeptide (TPR) repeat protein
MVDHPSNTPARRRALIAGAALLVWVIGAAQAQARALDAGSDSAPNARDLYNDGTQKFAAGKLPEAETDLQSAVESQDDAVQQPALYNLGHVRFQEGAKELKNAPSAKAVQDNASRASATGDAAIRAADGALAGSDINALVAAYMQGHGARRDLKQAIDAIKRALETYGAVLAKWQRSSGDFKSAHELQPSDSDSSFNADVVDRHIAKLVDMQRMMMQALAMLQGQRESLRQKMAAMKGKMPGQQGMQMPGGDDGDDDDEDKPPQGPHDGEMEGPVKNGHEMALTPEEAERLLGMLRLDSNRKLPMGDTETQPKKDKNRRDW